MPMDEEQVARAALERFHDELMAKQNVVGAGVRKLPDGGELGVAVYVSHKVEAGKLDAGDLIPDTVTVEIAGKPHTVRLKVIDVGGPFEAEKL